MSARTKIEWTRGEDGSLGSTWNPIRGCSRVSPGCKNCYAERHAARFAAEGQPWHGMIRTANGHPVWNGRTQLIDRLLDQPLRWERPRKIFVCSMSDLFHEAVPDEWIDRVFAVMALASRHTFQVLTKRAGRMRDYCASPATLGRVTALVARICDGVKGATFALQHHDDGIPGLRLDNVWLGVSVENQDAADQRIPRLLETPATVRFLSCEPLLEQVDLTRVCDKSRPRATWINCIEAKDANPAHAELVAMFGPDYPYTRIDWVIAGGESGPGARPMSPEWVRALRDQCKDAGVPFLMKQWGNWVPVGEHLEETHSSRTVTLPDGWVMCRTTKKTAGRLLDGVIHDAFPRSTAEEAMHP